MSRTPQTPLDKFFMLLVQNAGTSLPLRSTLNLLGFSVADNEANDSIDVTNSAASLAEVLASLPSPVAASALVAGTRYLVDSSGGTFTQALPNTGLVVGQWFEWTDFAQPSVWNPDGGQNLILDGQGNNVQDPEKIGITGENAPTVEFNSPGVTYRTTWTGSIWIAK